VYRPEWASGFGTWTTLHAATSASYATAALAMLVVGYRRATEVTDRRRVRVLLVGSLVGLIGILGVDAEATAAEQRADQPPGEYGHDHGPKAVQHKAAAGHCLFYDTIHTLPGNADAGPAMVFCDFPDFAHRVCCLSSIRNDSKLLIASHVPVS
jgi:hypothetical protein